MIIRRLHSIINIVSRSLFTFNEKVEKKPKRQVREDSNLQFFYRNLLRNTRIKQENGMGRFNLSHMNSMIKLTNTKEDSKVLFEAFCNLKGNFAQIPNTITDRMILKYLEVQGDMAPIIQLYQNHTFLSYFPHYDVTVKVMQSLAAEPQSVKAFLKCVTLRKFIKVNDEFIKEALKLVTTAEDSEGIQTVLSLARTRTDMFSNRPLAMIRLVNQYALQLQSDAADSLAESIRNKQYSSQEDVSEICNFYLNTNRISQSIILSAKSPALSDDQMAAYLTNLHDRIKGIREQGDADVFNKLKDEYQLIFSKTKLGAQAREVGKKLAELLK